MALNAIIVGGGIAGFSAAISLRRAGHNVRIYERSSFNNEIGAAIHVPPNASRALLAWGLDPRGAKFVTVKSSFRANAKTLERFHVGTTESEVPVKYGSPWFFAHRVDLHEELKRLATEPKGQGEPVEVHLRSEVVKYVSSEPLSYLIHVSAVRPADLLHRDLPFSKYSFRMQMPLQSPSLTARRCMATLSSQQMASTLWAWRPSSGSQTPPSHQGTHIISATGS